MEGAEKNDIIYIMTTEDKSILRVSYIDHKTHMQKRFFEIASSEPFKYCYFRYVYDAEEIYRLVEDYLDDAVLDDDDDAYIDGELSVYNKDSNDLKYIIDKIVKNFDMMPEPPPYRP